MKTRVEHLNDGDVIRYDEEATDGSIEVKAAWDQAEQDAKAGKRICLTDLIGMSETQHLKRVQGRK